jgi:hypothetical protein
MGEHMQPQQEDQEGQESQQRQNNFTFFTDNAPVFAALGVGILFVAIIASLFWPYVFGQTGGVTLLRELSTFEVARGLITFLVAVTTVGIALILTVTVVTIPTNSSNSDAAQKKFTQGKEVLTVLIGVLGTIVGFYFGSGIDKKPPAPLTATPPIAIKQIKVNPPVVKPGSTFNVSVSTDGIKDPVDYTIMFTPENIVPNKTGTSDKPEISTNVTVPTRVAAASLKIALKFTDKKSGQTIEQTGVTQADVRIAP